MVPLEYYGIGIKGTCVATENVTSNETYTDSYYNTACGDGNYSEGNSGSNGMENNGSGQSGQCGLIGNIHLNKKNLRIFNKKNNLKIKKIFIKSQIQLNIRNSL